MNTQIFSVVLMLMLLFGTKTFAAGIEITGERTTPEYWINKNPDGDKVLFTSEKIAKLNSYMLERDNYSADLKNYPQKISAETLKARIQKLSNDVKLSGNPAVMARRNLNAINNEINIRYAVTIERANVRILPQGPTGDHYDEIQATALDPAEPVAVLWESSDGKFSFVQAKNYFGWISKNSLAFTNRETWLTYVEPKNFLVVTNNKKFVNVNGKIILFQMGAIIPLETSDIAGNSWTARIPVIEDNQLKEVSVKVLNDDKVSKDFLPFTKDNVVKQSFKFLGDVYGWGGLDNSVDCSSFVQNIYRSMGVKIPRDADRQESVMPINSVFNDVTRAERLDIVSRAPVGALLFKPGHVMMKIGNDDNGTPIIIHAASSYYNNGQKIYVRKVMVSDLSYKNYAGVETLNDLTGIAFPR